MSYPLDKASDRQEELRNSLIEHLRSFPTVLPRDLLEAAKADGIVLNGGDFILGMKPTKDLSSESIYKHGFQGQQVIFLSTPSVRFAYNPETGEEIGNTMNRYNETDRTSLLAHWAAALNRDSADLRSKGLPGLAGVQDQFIHKIAGQLHTNSEEKPSN